MAKRSRQHRVIVLDSDDEEDELLPDGKKPQANRFGSVQEIEDDGLPEIRSKRKLQRTSHQPTLNSLFEPKNPTSRKRSHGMLPLEVITKSAVTTQANVKVKKGRARATLVESHRPTLQQSFDDRLWVEKYSPRTVAELVVHTKKIAEVKEWLQDQLLDPNGSKATSSQVLVLTGPAGVGKTAVVRVLAELLKIELLEWTTPAPELWHEYLHHAASGAAYTSKLDEFESFLGRARIMCSLPIVTVAPSTSQQVRPLSGANRVKQNDTKVLLIDDLPVANYKDHQERLAKSFYHLALSQNFPTIVVLTDDTGSSDKIGERDYQQKAVMNALEKGGARKIAFNPVTVNAMKKLLSKVQRLENCSLSSESISSIAESSAGDIRQSLTSLQFLGLGCQSHSLHHLMWDPGGFGNSITDTVPTQSIGANSQETLIQVNKSCTSVGAGRDYSLSLFHALGKFLHNKRHTEELVDSVKCARVKLRREFLRYPLNMEEPEVILSQAHTETATVLAFLHENVLQFIDEEAIDDVAAVASYFSDTDCLLGAEGSFRTRNALVNSNDVSPSQVAAAAASSVAARGVLFGNGHPAPTRWQSVRAPAAWQVDRQRKQQKAEIYSSSIRGIDTRGALSGSVQDTVLFSFYQKLSGRLAANVSPSFPDKFETLILENTVGLNNCDNKKHSNIQSTVGEGNRIRCSAFDASFTQMSIEDDIEDVED